MLSLSDNQNTVIGVVLFGALIGSQLSCMASGGTDVGQVMLPADWEPSSQGEHCTQAWFTQPRALTNHSLNKTSATLWHTLRVPPNEKMPIFKMCIWQRSLLDKTSKFSSNESSCSLRSSYLLVPAATLNLFASHAIIPSYKPVTGNSHTTLTDHNLLILTPVANPAR